MKSIRHIKRWIKASIIEALKTELEGKPFLVEGDDRLTSKEYQHIELRIDGPYIKNTGTRRERCAYIEVNLLCNSSRNEANVYDRENLQGFLLSLLDRDFCISRIGNVGKEPDDDETVVGSMQRIPSDTLKVSDFGMVDAAAETYQATAECHYEMHFTIED